MERVGSKQSVVGICSKSPCTINICRVHCCVCARNGLDLLAAALAEQVVASLRADWLDLGNDLATLDHSANSRTTLHRYHVDP